MTKTDGDKQEYCFMVPYVLWTGARWSPTELSSIEWVIAKDANTADRVAAERLAVRFGAVMIALKTYTAIQLSREEVQFLAATYGLVEFPSEPTELQHCKLNAPETGPQA